MDNNPDKVIDNKSEDLTNPDKQSNDTDKVIVGLKTEMIAERKKRQDAEKELEAFRAKEKADAEKKLLEDGKLKELLSTKEKELEALQSDVALANEYRNIIKAEREEAKKALGDNWDDSYDSLPISALRKLVKTFELPDKISDTDTGNNKKNQIPVEPKTVRDAVKQSLFPKTK